jgi:hypothetical protein
VQPRLNSVPLPEETLSGGLGSVSYNYSDNGLFMFQQPHNNIGMQNMQRFVEGRRLVHTNFTTGDHNETGNDRYAPGVGLQGGASTSRPVSAATSTTAAARRRWRSISAWTACRSASLR